LLALHISEKYDCSYVTAIPLYGGHNIFLVAKFISLHLGNFHSFIGYLLLSEIYTSCLNIYLAEQKSNVPQKKLYIAFCVLKIEASRHMTEHLQQKCAYVTRQKESSAQLLFAAPYQRSERIPYVKTQRSCLMSAILFSFLSV